MKYYKLIDKGPDALCEDLKKCGYDNSWFCKKDIGNKFIFVDLFGFRWPKNVLCSHNKVTKKEIFATKKEVQDLIDKGLVEVIE